MEELIEKAKVGDKQAFENLILLLQDDLYRIAETRLNNKDDIYDAIQETIITAFESIKNLRKIQHFKTWLIRILINESNNIYRQKKKRKIISFEEIKNREISDLYNIENIETSMEINTICKNLKYEDRMIIILYYMEKFTDKEIAKILNLKENTVTTKRTRAKKKIRENLNLGGDKT